MFPYKPKKYYRNYDKIKGKKVQGIMISNRKDDKQDNNDGWHASLTEEGSRDLIIDKMNNNGTDGKIQYGWIEYNFDMRIAVIP